MTNKELLEFITSNSKLSDMGIARLVKDRFPNLRIDSVRRRISFLRYDVRERFDREAYKKDLQEYLTRYENDSYNSIAKKIQLKYPQFNFHTIKKHLSEYTNWNHV